MNVLCSGTLVYTDDDAWQLCELTISSVHGDVRGHFKSSHEIR